MMGNNYESFHPECLEDEAQLLCDLGYRIVPCGDGKLSVETPHGTEILSTLEFAVGHARECLIEDFFENRIPPSTAQMTAYWDMLDAILNEEPEYLRARAAMDGLHEEDQEVLEFIDRAGPHLNLDDLSEACDGLRVDQVRRSV